MIQGRARTRLSLAVGVAACCLSALGLGAGSTLVTAQSASPGTPGTPSSPPPSASAAPAATGPVPITWTRSTKGKGFDKDPFFMDLAQAADGTVVMTGAVRDGSGRVTAAAWRTTDERAWSRVDWEATKPSAASAIVATPAGFIAVGGGVWTSVDGIVWTHQTLPDAGFRDLATTADGLVVLGQPAPGGPKGVPTLWTAPAATMTDPTTWQPMPLADVGYPQRVAVAPDGTIAAAGLLYGDPNAPVPAIWLVRDGVVTTGTFDGLAQAPTGIVDLRWTPAGFVMALVQNVAGAGEASVWVSSDGTSWTRTLDVSQGHHHRSRDHREPGHRLRDRYDLAELRWHHLDRVADQGIQTLRRLDRHRARGRQAPGRRDAVHRPQHLQGSDRPRPGGPAADRLDR